jgi:hypothetical protein
MCRSKIAVHLPFSLASPAGRCRCLAAMSDAFYDEIVDKATGAYKVLVNGEWRVSSSGKLTTIENPSKGQAAFQVQGA